MKTPLQSLAVRLPSQTIVEMKKYAKANNTTVSNVLRDRLSNVPTPKKFVDGGVLMKQSTSDQLVAIGGGSIVGLIVYKAVYAKLEGLEDGNKWKKQQELISFSSAVTAALLSGYGIKKLMESMK